VTKPRELSKAFQSLYGDQPCIYRAPGRVNLIGEHTDYNNGFVMPAAIDFSTWVAIAPREDRKIVVRSENFSESAEFELDEAEARSKGHWSDYPRGVAVTLEQAGHQLRGANMLIGGDIPIGSGLGSSAALEVATACALLNSAGMKINRLELAKLCQRAENEFVGMRCGLMDQFISCFGETGCALVLDCRSLEHKLLPLPEDLKVVVCNTLVKHELASSEYNARRAECEAGVRLLSRELPQARSLRDVTNDDLEQFGRELPDTVRRRCRHVVSENARVTEAASALDAGDLKAFGRLMRESHQSLRDDYEVSCEELDLMVDLANQAQGVFGARMTGGGFGGCTVNLVSSASVDLFKQSVATGYAKATGRESEIYICSPARGVERLENA
jgi:galactokinase